MMCFPRRTIPCLLVLLAMGLATPPTTHAQTAAEVARVWFEHLGAGEFDEAAAMAAPSESAGDGTHPLVAIWQQAIGVAGEFISLGSEIDPRLEGAVAFEANFATGLYGVRVTLDDENRPTQLWVMVRDFFEPPMEFEEAEVLDAATSFLGLVFDEDWAAAAERMDDFVKSLRGAEALEARWHGALEQHGALSELGDGSVSPVGGMLSVAFASRFELGPRTLVVFFSRSLDVMDFGVGPPG